MKMNQKFAKWVKNAKASATREILMTTAKPGVISFAGGNPAPELFPVEAISTAFIQAISKEPYITLQYSMTEGNLKLREHIAELMDRRGVTCNPDQIAFVHGSQQAIDLLGRIYLEPGDLVLFEEISFHGAVNAFKPLGVRYRSVPMDDEGMVIDELKTILKHERPKLIYSMPTFHNPTGISLSSGRRKALALLCAEYNVSLIEDDAYGEFYYEGVRMPALKAFDENNYIHYISTFSKILSPGLRLGWAVTSEEVVQKLNIAQQGATVQVGTLLQHAVLNYLEKNQLPSHLEHLRNCYRERRDIMIDALSSDLPDFCLWNRPEGGFYLWGEVNETKFSVKELYNIALSKNVAFIPGDTFFIEGDGKDNTIRLSFSESNPQKIREGILRLSNAIEIYSQRM